MEWRTATTRAGGGRMSWGRPCRRCARCLHQCAPGCKPARTPGSRGLFGKSFQHVPESPFACVSVVSLDCGREAPCIYQASPDMDLAGPSFPAISHAPFVIRHIDCIHPRDFPYNVHCGPPTTLSAVPCHIIIMALFFVLIVSGSLTSPSHES